LRAPASSSLPQGFALVLSLDVNSGAGAGRPLSIQLASDAHPAHDIAQALAAPVLISEVCALPKRLILSRLPPESHIIIRSLEHFHSLLLSGRRRIGIRGTSFVPFRLRSGNAIFFDCVE